jgi:hypothetical protein
VTRRFIAPSVQIYKKNWLNEIRSIRTLFSDQAVRADSITRFTIILIVDCRNELRIEGARNSSAMIFASQ